MLLVKSKTLLVGSLAVLLTACGGSELDKKSAKELYQDAAQHLYAKDAQYNFKADLKLDIGIENPFASNAKVRLSGAVNNNVQRYEFLPEIEAGMFNLKLPMLLDVKQQELVLDPSYVIDTIGMFAPQANAEIKQYKNKFVRFSVKNFEVDEADMAETMLVMTEMLGIGYGALNEFSKALPESSIQKGDLDDKAKELGAKTVLHVKLDEQQSKDIQQHINTYFYDQVKASTKLPKDVKKGLMEGFLDSKDESGYGSSESVIYLNEKGQTIRQSDELNIDVEGDKINIAMTIDYSNYGKAAFTVSPSKNDIVDFTEKNMRSLQDN